MRLAKYLASVTARRWQFGTWDCCVFMADWLIENGLIDPMADRRGTYTTREQYRRMLREEGGIVASCTRRFAALGLRETVTPQAGDVALVLAPTPTGAICTSATQRAVVATDVALAIFELPTIKAWTFDHA